MTLLHLRRESSKMLSGKKICYSAKYYRNTGFAIKYWCICITVLHTSGGKILNIIQVQENLSYVWRWVIFLLSLSHVNSIINQSLIIQTSAITVQLTAAKSCYYSPSSTNGYITGIDSGTILCWCTFNAGATTAGVNLKMCGNVDGMERSRLIL